MEIREKVTHCLAGIEVQTTMTAPELLASAQGRLAAPGPYSFAELSILVATAVEVRAILDRFAVYDRGLAQIGELEAKIELLTARVAELEARDSGSLGHLAKTLKDRSDRGLP